MARLGSPIVFIAGRKATMKIKKLNKCAFGAWIVGATGVQVRSGLQVSQVRILDSDTVDICPSCCVVGLGSCAKISTPKLAMSRMSSFYILAQRSVVKKSLQRNHLIKMEEISKRILKEQKKLHKRGRGYK